MDEIEKQISAMAETLEKASTDPIEGLVKVIKSLGADGLKARLPLLNDVEKQTLHKALTEMKKAISFDKEINAVKFVQGKVVDTIIQEDKADDDIDETLVKPEAAKMNHQGTPTDGWQGQVIKSLNEDEELLVKAIGKMADKGMDADKAGEKLEKKGVKKEKVQGALEKYKMKKSEAEAIEKGKMKEFAMAKDPNKEEEVKEPKKPFGKEPKSDEPKPKMKKSCAWEGEDRLLKANILGRNFNFNTEKFLDTVVSEMSTPTTEIKKSEKMDLNDLIEKSVDCTWGDFDQMRGQLDNAKAMNGKLVKSFEDNEIAKILGLTEEEAKQLLG